MTALIVGLGSMGKRRARLLKAVRPDIEIIGVDNSAGRRITTAPSLAGLRVTRSPPL